jgi:hypothetical protein
MGMNSQLSAISDQLLDAFVDFIGRIITAQVEKKEQTARRLELAMQKAFREQGKQFVRGLSKFRNRFGEAAQSGFEIGDFRLEIDSPFGDDRRIQLNEAIPPTEWMFVFHTVARKTEAMFVNPIDAAVKEALKSGAMSAIGDFGLRISFDLKNPRAVAYLDQFGARQVTKINETTRDFLNTIITQATNEGWSYKRTAEAIIERFNEFAIGMPQAHIDSRAHLIAVTETGNAFAEGNLMVAQDLKAAGIAMEKFWSTVGDDKVSQEICAPNEAQGYIEIDQLFQSGHMRPLGHPACRCDLLTRVKH